MIGDRYPLGTNRCVPRLPEALVTRPRLEDRLADGARCPVTLVSAPPGAGKTTLLASWLAGPDPPTAAWLNVDERDNAPGRLAALVAAALAEAGCLGGPAAEPAPADPAPAPAPDPDPAPDAALDAALDEIERRGRPCVLVLDDVQELAGPAALETLTRVVERVPAPLDLVLATRADPPVGLERLRLDGRLGEIRYIDLCFTQTEAAELFAAHDLEMSGGETEALWALVDGWPAGLRLAAAALRSEPDPASFVAHAAATQAAAADHLLDAVLDREDEAARQVLQCTSVVDRLTVDLAVALTGDPEAGTHVADLERRGLFLVELDDQRCYRYHALFRALLQARLRQSQPGMIEELHRRAAAWFLERGLPAEAEAHARGGGDWSLVGRLVLQRWLLGTTEEEGALDTGPLAGIPAGVVLDTPELALVAAAEACRWADHEDARLYRARLDGAGPPAPAATPAAAPDPGAGESAGAVAEVWDTARRLLDLTFGWTFGGDDRSWAAVDAVHRLDSAQPWTSRLRQLAVLVQAEMDIDAGRLDRARHALEQLVDHGDNGNPAWHRVLAGAVLAVLDAAAGDVAAAEDRLARTRALAAGRPRQTVVDPFVRTAAALCAAQRGEHRALAEALADPLRGDWTPRSLRVVERAVRAATRGRAPFFVSLDAPTARYPLAERALVALGVLEVIDATGRPIAVGGEGERAVADARQGLVETIVTGGNGPTPLAPVELRLDPSAPRHPRTAVEMAALAALAADRRGDERRADRLLCQALDLAAATSIRAPLLELGPHLVDVLERISARLGPRATAALDLLDRLQHAGGETLVEPLTDREIEVLQHLPTLMSNTEIARGLHLSVNTVKTHLKAVYRKLGVDGRREAVLRGRELELI